MKSTVEKLQKLIYESHATQAMIESLVLQLQRDGVELTKDAEQNIGVQFENFERADFHLSEAFVSLQLGRQRNTEANAHYSKALHHFKETINAGTPE